LTHKLACLILRFVNPYKAMNTLNVISHWLDPAVKERLEQAIKDSIAAVDEGARKYTTEAQGLLASLRGLQHPEIPELDSIKAAPNGHKPASGALEGEPRSNIEHVSLVVATLGEFVDFHMLSAAVHKTFPGKLTNRQIATCWRKIYQRESQWKPYRKGSGNVPAVYQRL
jgi:hypothetical protein